MIRSDTERVAIIPARGGSKRIPRKNLYPIEGRPLVQWAISTCLDSAVFDRVIVSTDDDEIASAAISAGAEVPFMRAAGLSNDHSSISLVVADALQRLEASAVTSLVACCVYPTAIGLLPEDLVGSAAMIDGNPAIDFVISVASFGHPVQRAMRCAEDGRLSMISPANVEIRTQDLETLWHDAGQFVWGRAPAWLANLPVLSNGWGYELPRWRAVDLDDGEDLARAEIVHRLIQGLG